MKLGLGLFWGGQEPEDLPIIARRADELGYESLWIWEHVVYPKEIRSKYLYTPDGSAPFADYRTLDPFVTLSHLAAVTEKIRLGTNIYVLPLRNPFLTARAVLTLDILSRGRVTLGAAVGWLEEEFELLGQDFRTRGSRADECAQVLKALWTQDEPEFHGKHFDFGPVRFDPKPVQKPHPPIVFGGETAVAMRRAARYGDGWMSAGTLDSPESAAGKVATLRTMRREAGREHEPFEIMVTGGAWVRAEEIERFEHAGVDRLLIAPWFSREAHEAMASEGTAVAWRKERLGESNACRAVVHGMERYAEDVMAKLPAVTA
jgi:probable F420-dependent oxidoreductase